uniref:Ubiquitin-like domain-containing protein n=5 Tax=Triticinae TaxID=1648030 RepID=A0A453C860_AEGTS
STPTARNSRRVIRATMMKLRCPNPKRLFRRSSSKISRSSSSCSSSSDNGSDAGGIRGAGGSGEIEWEVRPGGMLVQRRDGRGDVEVITVRVATGYSWHDVSIGATCTFGELKVAVSMVTGLEPREQRLLFRGKEREDSDHLHMVGVRDKDKVLLLEDPALKDIKLRSALAGQAVQSPYRTFIEV